MTDMKPRPRGRWTWPVIVGVIVIVLVIIIVRWIPCRFCPPTGGGGVETPFAATLEITHEDIAALVPISNSFSSLLDGDENADLSQDFSNYWFGTLLQLGRYGSTADDAYFTRAVFYDGEVEAKVLERNEFLWLNVVADRSDAEAAPLLPEEAFLLVPRSLTPGVECPVPSDPPSICDLVMAARGKTVTVEGEEEPFFLDESCLRTRQIHRGMERVSNVVTVWQGDGGHTWKVDPSIQGGSPGKPARRSRLLVQLPDQVSVQAWRWSEDCKLAAVELPDGIDRIVFEHDFGPGPDGGIRQDPPWP
jgi:hypothetical protein